LLRLIPTVDFVQKYDGGFSVFGIEFRLIDQFEQILFFARNSRKMEKIRLQCL